MDFSLLFRFWILNWIGFLFGRSFESTFMEPYSILYGSFDLDMKTGLITFWLSFQTISRLLGIDNKKIRLSISNARLTLQEMDENLKMPDLQQNFYSKVPSDKTFLPGHLDPLINWPRTVTKLNQAFSEITQLLTRGKIHRSLIRLVYSQEIAITQHCSKRLTLSAKFSHNYKPTKKNLLNHKPSLKNLPNN